MVKLAKMRLDMEKMLFRFILQVYYTYFAFTGRTKCAWGDIVLKI
jgi:hypothetical protein